MLTCTEMREQHRLSIRELKCIVVGAGIVHVELAKPSDLVRNCPLGLLGKDKLKSGEFTLNLVLEGNLCPGQSSRSYEKEIAR